MVRWALRAVVSGVVIAILLSIVPFSSVRAALAQVNAWVWVASVAIFFGGHYLNALRFRLLLGETAATPSSRLTPACIRAQYAGLVANLGLPGLSGGDLVRAAYVAPIAGVRRVTVASLADRAVDTVTVLILVVAALPFAGVPEALAPLIGRAALWGVSVVGAAVGATWLLVRTRRGGLLLAKVRESFRELSDRPGTLVLAAAISFGVQAAFVMTNVWLARQVGVDTAMAAWFVAWPLSKLVAVLPVSLGGIGVREAALMSLLVPYGAPGDAVLASGILWQGVLIATGVAGLLVTQLLPRANTTPASSVGKV